MNDNELEQLINTFFDEFWTTQDIAKYLGVSQRTVWQYKSNKKLPRPFGFFENKPLWAKRHIKEWFEEGKLSQTITIIRHK